MTTVCVCVGGSCHLKGAQHVAEELHRLVVQHGLEQKVELHASSCNNHCEQGVCVSVNGTPFYHLSPANVSEFFVREIVSIAGA